MEIVECLGVSIIRGAWKNTPRDLGAWESEEGKKHRSRLGAGNRGKTGQWCCGVLSSRMGNPFFGFFSIMARLLWAHFPNSMRQHAHWEAQNNNPAPWHPGLMDLKASSYTFLLVSSSSYTTLHLLLRCFWLDFTGFLYTLLYLICLRNGFIAPSLVGHTCLAFLVFAFGFCFWLAFWLLPSLPFWLACLTCLTFAVSCLTCVFRLAPCN